MSLFNIYFTTGEKNLEKQPAILTLKQYICMCNL